jgi:hypothetical protein
MFGYGRIHRCDAMVRRLAAFVPCLLILQLVHADTVHANETSQAQASTVWTALIPDAFPRYVYTWQLNADGTYLENGRDAATGRPIQSTLHGHWSRDGAQMILRQDGLPYVFDGVVLGNLYAGTMYFDGRSSSRFCAAKGELPPEGCNAGQGVAMMFRRSVSREP